MKSEYVCLMASIAARQEANNVQVNTRGPEVPEPENEPERRDQRAEFTCEQLEATYRKQMSRRKWFTCEQPEVSGKCPKETPRIQVGTKEVSGKCHL